MNNDASTHIMVFILSNFPPVFFFTFRHKNPLGLVFLHILVKNAKTV